MRWIVLSIGFFCLATLSSANTTPALVVRLVEASNELEQSDPRLEDVYRQLKKIFGFARYRQLDRRVMVLKPAEPVKVTLGKNNDFRLVATYLNQVNKGHQVKLRWSSGKTRILEADQVLPAGRPLLIKGPEVGNTWITLVLAVEEPAAAPDQPKD